ncbi:MAG: TIM barrel protein [Verrucomicrobia bacterium]|nr:TIM barrel protein [Verrucomicrobiota bacterium]
MTNWRVGNAPCSWGSLEFDGLEGKAIGFGQMLDELAATGYTGTELGDWGYMPTDPAALQEELHRRGLTLLGAFVPVALKHPGAHADGEAKALRVAQLLAAVQLRSKSDTAPFLVLADDNGTEPMRTENAGRVQPEMGLSEAEWRVFARGAESIARAVKTRTGLPTVFHHHCAGYVETPDEIAQLLARTDPGLLGLVFDTGHYTYGSGEYDPQSATAGLERFAARTWYVHCKDCSGAVARQARARRWDYFAAVRQGVFCELGQGVVDFSEVLGRLEARGYGGWLLVEQDVLPGLGTPKASALRNREYLRSIGA